MTTECPRCAAERSAASTRALCRLATRVCLVGLMGLLLAACWLLVTTARSRFVTTETVQLGGVLALGLVLGGWALVVALRDLAAEFDLRAATALPAPADDPLVHYRKAPTSECPQHPFAR